MGEEKDLISGHDTQQNTNSLANKVDTAEADRPLVTVVMPAYNAVNVLSRAVTSVQRQSLTDWELLIVDDGSTDGTARLAEDFSEQDPRIRAILLLENQGAAAARNFAIRAARGRFIAFLDADDAWMSGKLEWQIRWMQKKEIAISYTAFFRGNDVSWRRVDVPSSVNHRTLLRGNLIGCLTVVYDRQLLGRAEMPDFRRRQDYALWLKLLRKVPRAYGIIEPLAFHYREPRQVTLSSSLPKSSWATLVVYRKQENLSLPIAMWCLGCHLTRRLLWRARSTVVDIELLGD